MIGMLLQSQQAMQMQMLKESQDARAAEREARSQQVMQMQLLKESQDARAAEREARAAEMETIIARLSKSQKNSTVCALM